MSVASMSEPESSLREDASESDEMERRRLDLSGELSLDSERPRRGLRFGDLGQSPTVNGGVCAMSRLGAPVHS